MAGNTSLQKAKKAKNDEFYTRLEDIENELRHYKKHFADKTVLCNCDDPYESNFFKYFAMNFNSLGLKKLIATCYATSPIVYTQLNIFGGETAIGTEVTDKKPYKIEITEVEDLNGDGAVDLADVEQLLKSKKNTLSLLKGDGDFRSEECVELMKEADVVVTNPPFSLFREYVAQLAEYDKDFVIIGTQNAITYKEFFPLLKDNKAWLGYNSVKEFAKSDGTTQKFGNICWYTNLEIKKRYENINLYRAYKNNEDKYPRYDNYDAIEVGKVSEIPEDYDGVMGVPITFMDKYNPEQFEIVGATESEGKGFSSGLWNESSGIAQPVVNGERKYKRIFIIKKKQL